MDTNASYRLVCFCLLALAASLTAACMFTNHWFDQVSRQFDIIYHRGIWEECSFTPHKTVGQIAAMHTNFDPRLIDQTPLGLVYITDPDFVCVQLITGKDDMNAIRVLMCLSLGVTLLIMCIALFMKVVARMNMDIITIALLLTITIHTTGLSYYYELHREITNFNLRYALGYSFIFGWLAFLSLTVATIFSVLSRQNKQ